jgi:hypothetical protein
MGDLRQQRACIKFCFKPGKTAAEMHQMLKQAVGDNSLDQTQMDEHQLTGRSFRMAVNWHHIRKCSESWRYGFARSLTDHPRALYHNLVLSYGTWQQILLMEWNMRRIAVKFGLRLLQNEQKQHHVEVCRVLQQQLQEDPDIISKIVTGSIRLFFPKMKIKLKGRRFVTVEEIQADTRTVLNTLTTKQFHASKVPETQGSLCALPRSIL